MQLVPQSTPGGSLKITKIAQQVKRAARYSIFVDDSYCFSLSDTALLESKLRIGQELTEQEIRELKRLSEDDKIYNASLNYLAIRPRSIWEMETYLQRKAASPALIDLILNKLSINNLLNDAQFAEAFVRDRRLLRPTSRRKLMLELKKRHVSAEYIEQAVRTEAEDELTVLRELILRKQRQTRYQDEQKLMQYLARQGFSYGDIKKALQQDDVEY